MYEVLSHAVIAAQAHVYEDFARLPRDRLAAQAAQAAAAPAGDAQAQVLRFLAYLRPHTLVA